MDVLAKSRVALILAAGLAAALAGCSSSNPTPSSEPSKPAVKAPEAITGRIALQKMYAAARTWNVDAQPFSLESRPTKGFPGTDGKSAVWTVHFGSKSRSKHKSYTWSGSDSDDAPERGINPTPEDSFSATNMATQVFNPVSFQADSGEAYKTALDHGLRDWMKKTPGEPLVYQMRWDTHSNALLWRVSYGVDTGRHTVDVDATTGKFLQVEK